jgi:RimJ/RimL family protein N-acetyltransferase
MKIVTERLQLTAVSLSELEDIHALQSLPEVDQYNTSGIPSSIEETRARVSGWVEALETVPVARYVFTIRDRSADEFIGLFGITCGKPGYRSAELWYKLHPRHWNNGYATECVKAVLEFCFTELKLHRVEAGCATENAGSVRVLEKSGFIREAHTRKLLPVRGEWKDNYGYAILEEDFFKP